MLAPAKSRTTFSILLAFLGACTGWQPAAGQDSPPTGELKLVVVRGDGFRNNLKKRIAREPIVEVRDRNNKPVSGATVTFLLPTSGPGGAFANGQRVLSVFTGPSGRAVASGFTPNSLQGAFQIQVTASFQGQTAAAASIAQTNVAAAGGLAGLGTVATVGIVGATAAAVATAVAVAVGGGKTAKVSVGAPSVQ